ncbi:MAG: hypothetical protein V8Q30_11730 [Acutalibacteraceae bacterium]
MSDLEREGRVPEDHRHHRSHAEESRTPELCSELARAYNNAADVDDKEMYEKALSLLLPYEEHFQGDHNWNFRVGYAYYCLDQEGQALHYFEQALEARPGDEDTQQMIDDCRRRLALPRFDPSFRERTQEAWAAFQSGSPAAAASGCTGSLRCPGGAHQPV